MNVIKEQRDNVIQNNNTAQDRLIAILENIPKSTEVLEFKEELHGDLNFSILTDFEMGNIQSIILKEGEVTSIIGLPSQLKTLECSRNLLENLENLPEKLETLNISHNYLEIIQLSNLNVLQKLNISHNQIEDVENLPGSLTEFICNNNKLKSLNLNELTELKTLNISNNPITLVENLPEGIVNFVMENTPSIEFRNSSLNSLSKDSFLIEKEEEEKKQKKSYEESLFEYFRLKQQYEQSVRKIKRDAYRNEPTKKMGRMAALSIKPKCINCKRPVGSLFSKRNDDKYTILCGDTSNPCNLNVQIFNGGYVHFVDFIDILKDELNVTKEAIIRQKLDTIFSYISEEQSIEIFKKELESYNSSSTSYKEYLNMYEEYYHSSQKKEFIQKKNNKIFLLNEKVTDLLEEYKKTNNTEFLKTALKIQINEIYPEVRNRSLLENKIRELDNNESSNNYKLFKYPVEISKIAYNLKEEPRVMKYQFEK
jgi:Leucine-rich repeat (LRR) protein